MANPFLMIDIQGLTLSATEIKQIKHPTVAGVILFRRNYQNKAQLLALISALRDAKPTLIIAVDHEGGRVQRFIHEFTRIPPMKKFGNHYQTHPSAALQAAEAIGFLHAHELVTCGIDLSFSPVLDVDIGISAVIGDRSFSNQPEIVTHLARAWIVGMKKVGMAAVAKHYPGHGHTQLDSHFDLPSDPRTLQEIVDFDLQPFLALKDDYTAIMSAHVCYPAVDRRPCTLSKIWLDELLRKQFHFNGVIITDDLGMGAMKKWGAIVDNINDTLNAGSDMIIICNDTDATRSALQHPKLNELAQEDNPQHQARLALLRANPLIADTKLLQDAQNYLAQIQDYVC